MAARYAPDLAALDLARMESLVPASFDSRFGYCDSIAQDATRYCPDILALDRGIEFIALCNVLQDLSGARGVSEYVWQYLDKSQAGAVGRRMLLELRFDPRWQTIPAPQQCGQGQPLDCRIP